MRVLYFSRDYTPHDYRFLSAIQAVGHEALYLRLADYGRNLENRSLPEGIIKIDWRWGKGPYDPSTDDLICADLQEIYRQTSPDVIHSGPIPDCSWLAAAAGLSPHVAMSWGFDLMHDIRMDRNAFQRSGAALSAADWFLGDCYAERNVAETLGLDPLHATIFPWGIDTAKMKAGDPVYRNQLVAEDEFLMISSRSLEPNYDVGTTINAFILAAEEETKLKLLVLADGSQRTALHAIADAAPSAVRKRIFWVERVPNPEIVHYYRSADLYLSSSVTDGSSVSLLEAQACELPVLVSDIPGNREWVAEDETGYLFNVGDACQMADKMLWCYRHQDRLEPIRQAARRQIEEKADWEKNKYRLTEAYEQAIQVNALKKSERIY